MGHEIIQWCDRCGQEVKQLIEVWWGRPSEFKQRANGIEARNKAEVCWNCAIEIDTQTWNWTEKQKKNPRR